MISTNGLKRKSSSLISTNNSHPLTTKRFRTTTTTTDHDGNSQQTNSLKSELRQLQYELQCQEALLILMQKLRNNQRINSQTNNNNKQRSIPTATVSNEDLSKKNSIPAVKPPKQQSTKNPQPSSRPINNNNPVPSIPTTRPSSTIPPKNPPPITNTTNIVKTNNGINNDQTLLNAKLALRKQLEQTLLQIPTPKPTTCDLTYIPGLNGWTEFLTLVGLEQASNTFIDIPNRRLTSDVLRNSPNICAQCGTDWSVTWHEIIKDEKILCDRCRKSSQKKILKQDHSNRLRQAFIKALQQEKELDAKFQQQQQQQKQTTKTNSNKHVNNNNNNHSGKSKHVNPIETFPTNLTTNEQFELFQKHFLANMFRLDFTNQAAALAAKSTQQALGASLPVMAASLIRQANPAQYLLDMIPPVSKQQQQQHYRHSK